MESFILIGLNCFVLQSLSFKTTKYVLTLRSDTGWGLGAGGHCNKVSLLDASLNILMLASPRLRSPILFCAGLALPARAGRVVEGQGIRSRGAAGPWARCKVKGKQQCCRCGWLACPRSPQSLALSRNLLTPAKLQYCLFCDGKWREFVPDGFLILHFFTFHILAHTKLSYIQYYSILLRSENLGVSSPGDKNLTFFGNFFASTLEGFPGCTHATFQFINILRAIWP